MTQSIPPSPPHFAVEYGRPGGGRRSNGPAIASLVLGLLFCIPWLTGLLAILLGIIGMRKARDPSVGGKGLAVAGLVLGIVSVVLWTGCGGLFGDAYVQSNPARAVARQFLQDLSAGDINAAMGNSTGLTAAELQTQAARIAAFGQLQSVSFSSFNMSIMNGQTTMQLGGTATFSNATKTCTFVLVKTGGIYRVTSFSVQ
jgi:hypothetical protein